MSLRASEVQGSKAVLVRLQLAKIGARHSKADKDRIKQTHDLLTSSIRIVAPRAHSRRQCGSAPEFARPASTDERRRRDETEKLARVCRASLERPLAKALARDDDAPR